MSHQALLQPRPHGFALARHRTDGDEQRAGSRGGSGRRLWAEPSGLPGGDDGPQVVDGLPERVRLHQQLQLLVLLRLPGDGSPGLLHQLLLQLLLRWEAAHAGLALQHLLAPAAGGHHVPFCLDQVLHLGLEDLREAPAAERLWAAPECCGAPPTFCLRP